MGIFLTATPPCLLGRLLFGCDGFSATHNLKPERYDGVKEERERRLPIYQREQFRAIAAILLGIVIWLVARLMGLDIPFVFHFF